MRDEGGKIIACTELTDTKSMMKLININELS